MRLLNCDSLQLHQFFEIDLPSYAILSHTWGAEEVSFQDIQNGKGESKEGYQKIKYCCEQARRDGIAFAWVDTCCIDKSSSAELSEAINSMYRWYKNAQVCYAYLVDVPDDADARKKDSAFQKSKWFTRGWTLQELLAPCDLIFYSKGWVGLGEKEVLRERIAETTQIDETALTFGHLRAFGVAQKMAWASNRVTTRPEDVAYSLLGIVGVNMPLLYGEGGEKAFLRLQEEIMKCSDDQSLFAWFDPSNEDTAARGLIAKTPWEFRNCSSIVPVRTWNASEPYAMTNMGLRIKLSLLPVGEDNGLFLAVLNCSRKDSVHIALAIKVRAIGGSDQFARYGKNLEPVSTVRKLQRTIYVRNNPEMPSSYDSIGDVTFWIRDLPSDKFAFTLKTFPGFGRHIRNPTISKSKDQLQASLEFKGTAKNSFIVIVGYDGVINSPWCWINTEKDLGPMDLESMALQPYPHSSTRTRDVIIHSLRGKDTYASARVDALWREGVIAVDISITDSIGTDFA